MTYFVTKESVKEQMEQQAQSLVIVDVRYDLMNAEAGAEAYRAGHLLGAHYANLSHELSSPMRENGAGGRHPLPEPAQLARYLGSIGMNVHSHVIAYDDQGGAMASRLRWLLQWLGHQGDVSVLEGGYKGWEEAGYPVATEIPQKVAGIEYEFALNNEIVVDRSYVLNAIGQAGIVIIDSRDGARYRGDTEPMDKAAGHIPSAVNHFWQEGKRTDGTWKSASEQAERFSTIDKDAEVIVYCGSGVTATPNVFALQEAGFRNVKLYAGSWSDWSSDSGNPVATGDEEKE